MTGALKAHTRFSVLELEGTLQAPLNGELRQQVEALLGRNERRILVESRAPVRTSTRPASAPWSMRMSSRLRRVAFCE